MKNEKILFNKILNKDFIDSFFSASSITYDIFKKRDKKSNKYETFFERIIVSKNYCNKKYDYHFQHGAYRIERIVFPKWFFLTSTDCCDSSINSFKIIFHNFLNKTCFINDFQNANHGNWPAYHLHKQTLGSRIIIASQEAPVPNSIYDFNMNENNFFDEKEEIARIIFSQQFNIDLKIISKLNKSCAIIFLNDSASIKDWKIYKNDINTKIEGIKINLFISDFLYPFPKLFLTCKLLDKNNKVLCERNKQIFSEYELSHNFECETEGEIYTCEVKLFENNKLIDDYSGIPTRHIECSIVAGDK